jgi:hypothetical protein
MIFFKSLFIFYNISIYQFSLSKLINFKTNSNHKMKLLFNKETIIDELSIITNDNA